jgi:hypothetical protein
VTERDGNLEIYIINADGSSPTRVTNDPAEDFSSSWTSDGSRLIFDTNRDGNWEIYSIRLDGTDLIRLTTHPADDEFPVWRPGHGPVPAHASRSAPMPAREAGHRAAAELALDAAPVGLTGASGCSAGRAPRARGG